MRPPMKALVTAFFYFMASMTCTWNVIQECCSSETQSRHHEESHSNDPSHQKNHHGHSHEKKHQEKSDSEGPKTCCDKLLAPLNSSFKLLQQYALKIFQTFKEVHSLKFFVNQKLFCIPQKGPPFPIRGRPLYKILFPINAPPSHP